MLDATTKTVRRWYLESDSIRIRCRTKALAIKYGTMARAEGTDMRLIEQEDLFYGEKHSARHEYDRTALLEQQ